MSEILVVDDEARIADIMEKFLVMNGFTVQKAIGGEEALKVLAGDRRFDLLVIDIKMPRVSGVEVIRKIKESGKTFPILVFTGSVDAEKHYLDFKAMGVSGEDILYKPVDLTALLEKVKQKLGVN